MVPVVEVSGVLSVGVADDVDEGVEPVGGEDDVEEDGVDLDDGVVDCSVVVDGLSPVWELESYSNYFSVSS